jgi:hypothetical protein
MKTELSDYLGKFYERTAVELEKEAGDIFTSTEARGSYNVDRVKAKIEEHLPQKYTFAKAAEIFDREGNHTNCKDFLVYDRQTNVNLISPASSSVILPVDVVIATFEIKTTLDQQEIHRSLAQIQEAKQLKYLEKTIVRADTINGRVCECKYETTPPLGVIIAYDHTWSDPRVFEHHLVDATLALPEAERWDIFYVVNRAFFALAMKNDNPGRVITFTGLKPDRANLDVGGAFLNFLLLLESRLKTKVKSIPEIDFREEYNLSNWLWRMSAVSYDENGKPNQ